MDSESVRPVLYQNGLSPRLFYFLVDSYLFEDGVKFLQFQPFRGILFVLGRNIAACTRLTTVLVLRTLQNDLDPVALLCHINIFKGFKSSAGSLSGKSGLNFFSLSPQFLDYVIQAILIDSPQSIGGNFQGYPPVFLGQEKALILQVGQKPPLRLNV